MSSGIKLRLDKGKRSCLRFSDWFGVGFNARLVGNISAHRRPPTTTPAPAPAAMTKAEG